MSKNQFVVEVKEDIMPDVKEYAEAQGLKEYEWIEWLIRKNCRPDDCYPSQSNSQKC